MSEELKSLELMRNLQPFTQMSLIPAARAQEIVRSYRQGDRSPLKELVLSPDIPAMYGRLCQQLEKFL